MSTVEFTRQGPSEQETADNLMEYYVMAADLQNRTFDRTWVVEGLIEKGRIYEVFGKWKEGKTLSAMDMVATIAIGGDWANRRTKKSLIVYVAGEAVEDIELRLAAWQRKNGIKENIPFAIRIKPVYLTQREFAQRLAAELQEFQRQNPDLDIVLVIDTLARNFGAGKSENSDEGMGAFANNLIDIVVRPSACTCLVVHHSGHGDGERGRGHSSFAGAVDGSIKVALDKTGGPSVVTVSTTTSRNTAGDDALSFRIEVQVMPGEDNFGNAIEAPVLRYLSDHIPDKKPSGKHESSLYDMINQRALEQFQTIEASGRPAPEYVIVSIDEIRESFKASINGAPGSKTTTWTRVRAKAIDQLGTVGDGFKVTRNRCGFSSE